MKVVIALVLSLGVLSSAYSQRTFREERGDYSFTQKDLENYYQKNELNYFSFKKHSIELPYKINKNGQFQIKNWYDHDWFSLQENYEFSLESFLSRYDGATLNEAKKNYYSSIDFSKKRRIHKNGYIFPREWGGLNHPPFHKKLKKLNRYSKNYEVLDYSQVESGFFDVDFNLDLDQMTGSKLSFNNSLNLLEDNESYLKKLELIRNAKKSIFMSSLVFVCDSSTKVVVNELIKKSQEGLSVRVLVDKFIGTFLIKKTCVKKMEKAGVAIIRANDFWKYEGRTVYHNKMLIVDSRVAIVGGQNMLNADNLSRGTDFRNRDVDLLIEGPLVREVARYFLEDYEHFYKKQLRKLKRKKNRTFLKLKKRKKKQLSRYEHFKTFSVAKLKEENQKLIDKDREGKAHYSEILNDKEKRMQGVCRIISQAPYRDRTIIGKVYLKLLEKTQYYLGIQTPELLDTKYKHLFQKSLVGILDTYQMYYRLHDRLMELGDKSGFHMDLITTGHEVTGNEIVDDMNQKIRRYLEENNIRKANKKHRSIRFWNKFYGKPHYKHMLKDYVPRKNVDLWLHMSFIHSKIFYFDRIAASIGSYNLEHNATDHSYENTIVCFDKNLNEQLDELMVRDMANSVPFRFNRLYKK